MNKYFFVLVCLFEGVISYSHALEGSAETVINPHLNIHGRVVSYYASKADDSIFDEFSGSGFLINGSVVTVAHNIFVRSDNAKDLNHRQTYSEIISYMDFITPDGKIFNMANYDLPDEWMDIATKKPEHLDVAVLYFEKDEQINAPLSKYVFSLLSNDEFVTNLADKHAKPKKVVIFGYPDCKLHITDLGTCYVHVKDKRRLMYDIPTLPGMSGGAICYEKYDQHFVLGIHTGNIQLNSDEGVSDEAGVASEWNCGVRITSSLYEQFLTWMNSHAKKEIWQSLKISPVFEISHTQWMPVIFSIQGDQEFTLQESFMTKLNECLQTCGVNLIDVIDVWSGSGKAGILALNHVKPRGDANTTLSQVTKPLILLNRDIIYDSGGTNKNEKIESVIPCLMNAPSVDSTKIGADKALELYPDSLLIIVSLGVSENSKDIHDLYLEFSEESLIYKRINYFQFEDETDQIYQEKLDNQVAALAALLYGNHNFRLSIKDNH